jgi:hypothetical protein
VLPEALNGREDGMGIKRNVGRLDRGVRIAGGSALLLAWALWLRGNGLVLGLGLAMFAVGLVGFCPVYVPFKISTLKRR